MATIAAASWCSSVAGFIVELELRPDLHSLPVAEVQVGSPPQHVRVQIDTGSSEAWLVEAGSMRPSVSGFCAENSSTAKVGEDSRTLPIRSFDDERRLDIKGVALHDTIKLGGSSSSEDESGLMSSGGTIKTDDVSLLLARNYSGNSDATEKGIGLLGLVCPKLSGPGASNERPPPSGWRFGAVPIAPRQELRSEGNVGQTLESFFDQFWEQHPEVPKIYRFELGGNSPRLIVGEPTTEGPRLTGGTHFLSTSFTSKSPRWYASVRAMGLSSGVGTSALMWNLDFNARPNYGYGAPALLDTGVQSIRMGSLVYNHLTLYLPTGCQKEHAGTSCPCEGEANIDRDFPSISLSFEAAETMRFMGLDSGADVIVCIPPRSYVTYQKDNRCFLAIEDGGRMHMAFGLEFIVLGIPFFRSAQVVLDLERRQVGIGPALTAGTAMSGTSGQTQTPQDQCPCADPKNWWSTGKRISPKRIVVALCMVAALAIYIYVGYSPSETAERIRTMLNGFCGGLGLQPSGQTLAGGGATAPLTSGMGGMGPGAEGLAGRGHGMGAGAGGLAGRGGGAGGLPGRGGGNRRSPDRPFIQMSDRSHDRGRPEELVE